ncbi:MAG TPA: response regulator transcription factor [Candidatus Dormibacteraeota bacterium]|jgi:DNA-binding NarL/FixJ family response regulator
MVAVDVGARREAPASVRVLVVQDHPLLATAIARVLEAEAGVTVCGIVGNGADAALVSARENAAVVVMDYRLPDMTGPAAATMILTACPSAVIVFHSADDSEVALLDSIDAGAAAYLTKSATADEIVQAVLRSAQGDVLIPVSLFAKAIQRKRNAVSKKIEQERLIATFTGREFEVLNLLAEGLSSDAMSKRLRIANHTVEWHVRHVIEKLQVHSKLQAVVAAARLGIIQVKATDPSAGGMQLIPNMFPTANPIYAVPGRSRVAY